MIRHNFNSNLKGKIMTNLGKVTLATKIEKGGFKLDSINPLLAPEV